MEHRATGVKGYILSCVSLEGFLAKQGKIQEYDTDIPKD
jgi:hypothetical protein